MLNIRHLATQIECCFWLQICSNRACCEAVVMSAIEGHSLITLRVPLYPYLIHHGFNLVWTSCWVNLKQGVGNESIFVMVDPFSKMAHLMSHTKTDNASCIVNLFFKKVVRFPWIPTSIYFFTFQFEM